MSDRSPEEHPREEPVDESTEDVVADEQVDVHDDGAQQPDDESTPEAREGAAATRPGAPVRRRTAQAPVKKTGATRKRKDAEVEHEDPYKAKNPAHFARQSAGELKKVVWPTWPTLVKYFFAVLAFVLFIIAIVSGLDALFGWSLLQLLGSQ